MRVQEFKVQHSLAFTLSGWFICLLTDYFFSPPPALHQAARRSTHCAQILTQLFAHQRMRNVLGLASAQMFSYADLRCQFMLGFGHLLCMLLVALWLQPASSACPAPIGNQELSCLIACQSLIPLFKWQLVASQVFHWGYERTKLSGLIWSLSEYLYL